ncbi:MAG: tRNA glutamyl-Q(34) synthetase GluQRS, partial [bacterium]|nr:tRNA glutamyl-Q(34) synthetase GluQRS [bacterium]
KRRGDATLTALRDAGLDPRRVVGALATTLGWLDEPRPVTPTELLTAVDVTAWPVAATRWRPDLDAWLRTP